MRNRIFVVEDDPVISKLIYVNLFAAGYEAVVLDDGEDAYKHISEGCVYDLAILDIMLPGRSGLDLLPEFNERDIPVIFLTAKADVFTKVTGLKGGAEDYIVKPFEILELLVRIEMVLKRRNKTKDTIGWNQFQIDLKQRRVFCRGEEVTLKPMEFDLLVVLAKNKNIAMSRNQLLKYVWGDDYCGETRTVDVHVAQLRKKLGDSVSIVTVSKLGYRLEEGTCG